MKGKILNTLEFDKIIHKLANHASTSLGKGKAQQLQPSNDFTDVKSRLQATDEAAMVERIKGSAPFGGIRDIKAAVRRATIGGTLNAAELLDVANTIAGGGNLRRMLLVFHREHPVEILEQWCQQISELQQLEADIKACIDDQAEVMDHASAALNKIRRELRTGESQAREKLEQMIRTPSTQKMLQDNLVTMRNNRYVIPVKQEYRNHFGGMIHDHSASGATLFIEPEAVVIINNKLRILKMNEEQEIEKILIALTVKVADEADELLLSVEALSELDFIFAKAGLARTMKASLPRMNDRGFIKLKKGRHPLIEHNAVPLDVEIGNSYSTIIITGPNTGGKTVSLKTIGLLNLMAMSGLFIPAEEGSQMCVFDAVYADIGDEQSIEQSLSTFSSHMVNIIGILHDMTPKSLVLMDELGAGTDPAEGSALAIAILEYVHGMGSRMIATTHFSELKAYAYERKGIINASMEFDVQTLSPTYRLLLGVPGRSNAFAIAERLGLQKDIIDNARGLVGEEDQRVESMIASLEENRRSSETDRLSAEQLRQEAEKLRRELFEQQQRFQQQREKLMVKAEEEARQAVARARNEAEEVIADLRKMALEERASIKEHKLTELKRRLDEAIPSLGNSPSSGQGLKKAERVQLGDEVLVHSLKQKGHVVEKANDMEVIVQLGIMKMKVKVNDLQLIQPSQNQQVQRQITSIKRSREANIRTELDLRGMNLEEAIIEIDQFLDEAFLANLGQVQLIHGKGTGVLRNGIQDYLRKHKHVKKFRLGNYGEGGDGVTIAEFN